MDNSQIDQFTSLGADKEMIEGNVPCINMTLSKLPYKLARLAASWTFELKYTNLYNLLVIEGFSTKNNPFWGQQRYAPTLDIHIWTGSSLLKDYH